MRVFESDTVSGDHWVVDKIIQLITEMSDVVVGRPESAFMGKCEALVLISEVASQMIANDCRYGSSGREPEGKPGFTW